MPANFLSDKEERDMKVGIYCHNSDEGADPLDVARLTEELGFESFFCAEHTHIPVSRESPYPMPPWELPREHFRMRDPFVTLSAAAAVTERIRLGTAICLVVCRDPILLAKTTASLDLLSKGRVILGVGAGWNLEEMANHGTNPKTRTRLMEERVRAIKEIWTKDEAEFHGEFVNFDPIFAWPKPVQKPYPPVLIGGGGPTVIDRVIGFGDGWLPGHQKDLNALGERIDELHTRSEEAGRGRLPVTIMMGHARFFGDYARIGAERVVVEAPAGEFSEVRAMMTSLAEAMRKYEAEHEHA